MATPCTVRNRGRWLLDAESSRQLETSPVGSLRAGGDMYQFTGGGVRIRRQDVRKLEGFWGHCWQSALFPSGRGFGARLSGQNL
ncbi:hypothetical protein [Mycobacterium hodleri]|uniref:hypothetical protein n=1 Tax=Mycolicibacterium hodleri TaxID=49897 RepID=UPI001477755E